MEEWDGFVQKYSCDNFWIENQPAFYAYNYGTNIEIKLNKQLRSLLKETRLRQNNKESKLEEEDTSILKNGT
jgi:hypothetical protein